MSRASKQTYAQGVRFVGIDTRDTHAAAQAFRRSFGITYPSVVDKQGQLLLGFTQVIPIGAIPSTLVVDPSGHITARVVGAIDYSTLRGLISDVLAKNRHARASSSGGAGG